MQTIIGIVAEWNPFHKGHVRMISEAKDSYANSNIISVMSGSFVQRGEPALFDKWMRASWALQNGVDAVFELPFACAVQSADRFAFHGVSLLHQLGANVIAFGTESIEKEELYAAAHWSLTSEYNDFFHEFLNSGASYATAANLAMGKFSHQIAEKLTRPNNLLGFKYVEAIIRNGYEIDVQVVHRDMEKNISATFIRNNLDTALHSFLPDNCKEEAYSLYKEGKYTNYSRYDDACLLISKLSTRDGLIQSQLFSEGLDRKWEKESKAETYSLMLKEIKSKRYLYSRLRRIGASLLVNGSSPIPKLDSSSLYGRLLALKASCSHILKSSRIPIITKIPKAEKVLNEDALRLLYIDVKATDIFNYCQYSENARAGKADFYRSPIIL